MPDLRSPVSPRSGRSMPWPPRKRPGRVAPDGPPRGSDAARAECALRDLGNSRRPGGSVRSVGRADRPRRSPLRAGPAAALPPPDRSSLRRAGCRAGRRNAGDRDRHRARRDRRTDRPHRAGDRRRLGRDSLPGSRRRRPGQPPLGHSPSCISSSSSTRWGRWPGRRRKAGPSPRLKAIVAVVMAAALLTTGVVAWRSFKARPTTAAGPWRWTAEVALAAGCARRDRGLRLRRPVRAAGRPARRRLGALRGCVRSGSPRFVRRDRLAWLAAAIQGGVLIAVGALVGADRRRAAAATARRSGRGGAVVPLLNLESLALAALAVALVVAGVGRRSAGRRRCRSARGNRPWAHRRGCCCGCRRCVPRLDRIVDVFQARVEPGVDARPRSRPRPRWR